MQWSFARLWSKVRRSGRSPGRQWRPRLEGLEQRIDPALTKTTFAAGQLVLSFNNRADNINLSLDEAGGFLLNGTPITGGPTLANTTSISVVAGGGNDVVTLNIPGYAGGTTVDGGAGNDLINGSDSNDLLIGGLGHDTFQGGGGNDTVTGGKGNDNIDGGAGVNTLMETVGSEFTIDGVSAVGLGNDAIANIHQAQLIGTSGRNIVDGIDFNGPMTVDGSGGADLIFGGRFDDVFMGGAGNDFLSPGGGNDVVDGGAGNDQIFGGAGNDSLQGAAGNDTMDGQEGNDTVRGGAANDRISGREGNDVLDGGDGKDTLVEGGNFNFILTDALLTGNGIDTLTGFEQASLVGGDGDNNINASGFTGNTTLDGGFGNGNDTLVGGTGKDLIIGGRGNDSLSGGGGGQDKLDGGLGADVAFGDLTGKTLVSIP